MKRILYIPLLLLFYACESDDAIVDNNQATTVKVPFTVSISTNPESGQTKAPILPPEVDGATTANTVKIYVFEDTNGSEDLKNPERFLYKEEGTITENINGTTGDYIAKGNFTATSSASYRIIAFAYDSNVYGTELAEPLFTVGSTSFSTAMVTLQNKVTPELFAGNLRVKDGVSDVISKVDGTTELTGNLFRAVGYVSITLTNIPDDVNRLAFVSQKFATTKNIYNKNALGNYPLWYVDLDLEETYASVSTVAKESFENNGVTLKSFFFPLGEANRTFFYIDVLKNGSSYPIRLQVKCADTKWDSTVWLGLFDKLVSSNSFVIPVNWQLKLSGAYSTLASGNIKIDASPITDSVDGGVLIPLNP